MEPIDIIKKYLLDYDRRVAALKDPYINMNEALLNKDFKDKIVARYFSEALERFLNIICEKQRAIIKDNVMKHANINNPFDVVATIENSGYPIIIIL